MMVGEIFERDGDIVIYLLICKKMSIKAQDIDDRNRQDKIILIDFLPIAISKDKLHFPAQFFALKF